MAGSKQLDKFFTTPEDPLEPLDAPEKSHEDYESAVVQKTLRILETETGELYINPDVQHIGSMRTTSDIVRIYSREIQALRKVVTLLMGIIIPIEKNTCGTFITGSDDRNLRKIIKYLENASWEWALLNDPRGPGTHPE